MVIDKFFAHSHEKLWRPLTEPALLAEWLLRKTFFRRSFETFISRISRSDAGMK